MQNKVEKKNVLFIICLLACCFSVFIGLIYWDVSKVINLGIIEAEHDNSIIYSMPEANKKDGYIRIEGAYALIPGEKINVFNSYVILQDVESKKCYRIPTLNKNDKKINDEYSSDIDYSNSGFSAYVKTSKIDCANKQYEILIWYGNDKHNSFVHTGKYVG